MTGWQGLIKVYEKVLDGSEQYDDDRKERSWNLEDVATAYIKVLSICSQNTDIDRYIAVSGKLSEFYLRKTKNVDKALEILSERISFLENHSDCGNIKETYTDIIRLLNSESQTNELDEKKTTMLCTALEKVNNCEKANKSRWRSFGITATNPCF